MTTMVEKVARAMADAFTNGNMQFDEAPEHHQRLYIEAARAAIEALMEPTEAMLDAGDAADGYDVYVGVWTAMIQAALKEGQ